MTSPRIVTVETSAELLQQLPLLTGFDLRDCLVCVAFREHRSAGAFRLALPIGARLAHIPAATAGLASRFPADTEFVVIIYGLSDAPNATLARSLEDALHAAGYAVRETLWQSATAWGNYVDNEPHAIAGLSRPSLVVQSPNSVAGQVDCDARFDASASQVRAVVRRRREAPLPSPQLIASFEASIESEASAAEIADTIMALEVPALRDLALLQWAFGREAAADAMNSIEQGRRPELLDSLAGRGRVHPSFARNATARTACYRLRALGFEYVHAALWTIEGWLCWAAGESSRAGECFEYAIEIDPEYTLAKLCDRLVRSGHVPDWAFPVAA